MLNIQRKKNKYPGEMGRFLLLPQTHYVTLAESLYFYKPQFP